MANAAPHEVVGPAPERRELVRGEEPAELEVAVLLEVGVVAFLEDRQAMREAALPLGIRNRWDAEVHATPRVRG